MFVSQKKAECRKVLSRIVILFLVVVKIGCFTPRWLNGRGRQRPVSSRVHDNEYVAATLTSLPQTRNNSAPDKVLIHWKGEGVEGYSMQFRHVEFLGALSAVLNRPYLQDETTIAFTDALNYTGATGLSEARLLRFNQAMQYVNVISEDIPRWAFVAAAERCSLLHALYEVVVDEGETYADLTTSALQNNAFADLRKGRENGEAKWCVRVRHYGEHSDSKKETRYGARARSVSMEKEALLALEPLLSTFGAGVNLENPDCKIYIFDGLRGGRQKVLATKVLARRMTLGPQVSSIAPKTRICATNTPLCPIASFCLCNVAGIRPHDRILDPFAGSCATLLAAAMIEPSCQTVGIEIAHDGLVNRDDIRKDFESRQLVEPVALLQGDSTGDHVRAQAREAVGGGPFDLIITDPPYGIRESKLAMTPIDELFKCLCRDRAAGTPLLKLGGKLVCFIPCEAHEDFATEVMPTEEQVKEAGLRFELAREQPLNDSLSRWLVSFICTV
jgi:tRNA G10  N-methylase Trm11